MTHIYIIQAKTKAINSTTRYYMNHRDLELGHSRFTYHHCLCAGPVRAVVNTHVVSLHTLLLLPCYSYFVRVDKRLQLAMGPQDPYFHGKMGIPIFARGSHIPGRMGTRVTILLGKSGSPSPYSQ